MTCVFDLGINEQIDFFGQQIGNFADEIAAENVDERVAARRAKD